MKRIVGNYLGACLFAFLAIGCDSGQDPNSSGSTVETKTKSNKVTVKDGSDSSPAPEKDDGKAESVDKTTPKKPAPTIDPAEAKKREAEGRAFFADTIEPQFQTSCSRCHAEPRFNPDPAGPLSIFDYDSMKIFLKDGTGKLNNRLMDKARAQIAHAGGSACGGDVTGLPCSVIMEWWEMEFGVDTGGSGLAGEIELVKFDGNVFGYAASVLDANSTLSVDFYINGDKDTGTKLTSQMANKSGYSGGVVGPHRFQFMLPDTYRNAVETQLYAYATVGTTVIPLKGSPFKFKAWKPKGNAAFYNNKFTGCGCHSRTYEGDYSQLGTPSPYDGGSATNNKMYIMGAGGGHSGGGYDTGFVSNWWNAEFGP